MKINVSSDFGIHIHDWLYLSHINMQPIYNHETGNLEMPYNVIKQSRMCQVCRCRQVLNKDNNVWEDDPVGC